MKRFILIFICIMIMTKSQAMERYVIGYYRAGSRNQYPPAAIPYKNLTHIAHAFIWPGPDGSLKMGEKFLYPELIQTAHRNGVKVVVSIGGWGKHEGFAPMVANPQAREKFVSDLVQFCLTHGYDGADLDWEYPTAQDKENLSRLIVELRQAFQKNKIPFLSAAVPAIDWEGGFDAAVLKERLDWFGIMTYDFHGSWTSHVGHNSPLYSSPKDKCGSAADSAQYWREKKELPPDKLCLGIPFYGRMFEASDLYLPGSEKKSVSYADAIIRMSQGWEYSWDEVCRVGYLQNPGHSLLISFDDVPSVQAKCNYVLEKNLKGVIIWALGHDDTGTTQPLLSTVGEILRKK